MDAKEIVHCGLKMERLSADRRYGDILALLCDLDKSHITAEQLETTDIVKVLYRLRKNCCDGGVKETAKSLMSKWKRQYSKDAQGRTFTDDSKDSLEHTAADGGASLQACDHGVGSVDAPAGTEEPPVFADVPTAATSSDFSPVRTKCVQLLRDALCSGCPDRDKAAELAGHIEQHIHGCHGSSGAKYKACVRSKVANLKNPRNGHLHRGLLSGALAPGAFARMSAAEMACADLRRLREEYSARGVCERQLPQGVEGTQTQRIRCKGCGGRDCRVTQVSRGALFLPAWVRRGGPDEDAMTFVTCGACGQQWYHSGWVCL